MHENEFVKKAINSIEIEKGRFSCLGIAIKDARLITGRNIVDGKEKTGKHDFLMNSEEGILYNYSFIGVIDYLLILDLIGTAFRKKQFQCTKTNPIYKALKQFSKLTDDEIFVIIALRNSLAHNYSLVNIPKDKNEYTDKLHHFKLINTRTSKLVEISTRWLDGEYSSKSEINETSIGLDNLFDMIEEVIANLKDESNNDFIELNGIKFEDFKMRFTIM
jgi:hypothetical protein